MPKKVKNKIKIIPKLAKKTNKVLFSIKGKILDVKSNLSTKKIIKKSENKINKAIVNNWFKSTSDRANIVISKISKDKGFRYVFYSVKYFIHHKIVKNILNALLEFIKYIKNLFEKISKIFRSFSNQKIQFNLNFKKANIFNRIKYFLTPDSKENWLADFKNFSALLIAVVIVSNILFLSNKITKDLEKIVATTAYAQESILSGIEDVKEMDTKNASNKFYLALQSFYNLEDDLRFITKGSFNLIGGVFNITKQDIDQILVNLENISRSSIKLVEVINSTKDSNFLIKSQKSTEYLSFINKNIQNIDSKISKINTNLLPENYKIKLLELKNKISFISNSSEKIIKGNELLRKILAENDRKRFLLVFQNANEIRATGGFMGSYALIDIKNGEIIQTEVPGGGTYDLKGSFVKNIEPPLPFKLLVKKWEIQDSNWFLDFEKSASKITEFFEGMNNSSSIDGVIAINSNIFSDLIDLTGDISLEKYDIKLTKDNAVDSIQEVIKSKRDTTNKPKEIISDLFSEVSKNMFSIEGDKVFKAIDFINNSINKKNILTYFKDSESQNISKFLSLSGEVKNNAGDYLAVVDSNIGGGKTSQYIEKSVSQKIKIMPTGEVIVDLEISRKYNQNKDILDRNIEFIRVFTPIGSKLISANGFSNDVVYSDFIDVNQIQDKDLLNINKFSVKDRDSNTLIFEESNKTVFGNFLYLDPGEEKVIKLSYKLPFKFDYDKLNKNPEYNLYLQSQPGNKISKYFINIKTLEKELYSSTFDFSKDKEILIKK